MELFDFLPKVKIQEMFDGMMARTMAQLPSTVGITLRFAKDANFRIWAGVIDPSEHAQRYEVVICEHLVRFVTNYMFVVARCLPVVCRVNIPDPRDNGIGERWQPDVDPLEGFINRIPDDLEIEGERIDLFLALFRDAWDLLLYHETAHITEGHLLFKLKVPYRFNEYSRSCELEADDRANRWIRERATDLKYSWIAEEELQTGGYRISSRFTALVASILFLSMRIRSKTFGDKSENYLPHELRHALAVIQILQKTTDLNREEQLDAWASSMAEALRVLDFVTGWPQREVPALVMDISFEDQEQLVQTALAEHKRLHGDWARYKLAAMRR